MSLPFGSGSNPYGAQGAKKDDVFDLKPKVEFEFKIKKTLNDLSLFDLTSEDDLNDRGKKLKSEDIFEDVPVQFDGPKWLGLTGKGTFGDEPELMKTTFLSGPPKQIDKDGNPVKAKDNGNDWNWNTFA